MSDAPQVRGSHARGGVAEARAALIEWVDSAGDRGRVFLEAHISRPREGAYRVRHRDDADLPAERMQSSTDPFQAREIAQITAAGEHRHLKTAPNLRRGWTLEPLDANALWIALDYLYPACAMHWYAGGRGTLRVTHWKETAGRQSGIYSAVGLLSEQALRDTSRACCGDAVCQRRIAWGIDAESPEPLPSEMTGSADAGVMVQRDALVPCPEACSMFISFARKVLTLERSRRQELPGLGMLAPAEVEQIRAIVGAAAAGTLGATREGEFDQPTNQRRVRYLAARLEEARPESPEEALPCEGCPRPVKCAGCPLA